MTVENNSSADPPPASGDETPPPAGDGTPPPASNEGTPPAGEAKGDQPPPDEIKFPSQEKLNERMDRHFKSKLKKELGIEDPTELKKMMDQYKSMEKAEEERKRQAMSEQERLQADLEAEKARASQLQAERDQIRFESHVNAVCAELGITNIDYAMYEIAKATDAVAEGDQLDAKEHLSGLLEGDSSRAALGLPPKTNIVPKGANTGTGQNDPPPDPNRKSGDIDVSTMTQEEFQAHLASKGVGLPGM